MKKVLYFTILSFVILSCNSHFPDYESAFVEINGEVLKKSEILAALPEDANSTDSSRFVNEYVESWIKHQLLLQKAELNVGNNPEIQKLVDNYKEQLLIENYLRLLVEQKAEIKPTKEQVESFYEENKEHYILPENLLKGIFIVLPLDASNKNILMELLKAEETDKTTIEAYCLQNAAKVDFFLDDWIAFRLINQHIPELNQSEEQILKRNHFFETEDSLFQYILRIDDYKIQGNTSPLNYVYKEIEEYLLNSNKVTYLQRMKNALYDEAKRKGIINYND